MRSLLFIVARSLRQHLLSTIITVISAGLASGLVMSVFTVSEQSAPVDVQCELAERISTVFRTFFLVTASGRVQKHG